MPTQGSGSAVPTLTASKIRRCADYHPSLWGDYFLTYASDLKINTATQEQHKALKEEVRKMVTSVATNISASQKEVLQLIDAAQRLGVAYHFEKEIKDVFRDLANNYIEDGDDLYTVSLQFRLLRQQGIKISCDVFNKFKDKESKYFFKESLIKDVRGMLSLYEAAYLGIRGEEILDEALVFTTTHLKSMVAHDGSYLAQQINNALCFPLRKALPRLKARELLDIYSRDASCDQTLLQFAKLDFNIVQAEHQKELCELTRWWGDLDFSTKVPYARNRLVELYFWVTEMCAGPKYAFGRILVTKTSYIISVIDDTFDAYGTFEELQLFTEAVKRWDIGAIDILPEYMKIIYKTLLDIYCQTEVQLAKEGRSQCIHYAKEKMQELIEKYFIQAKWLNEGYFPAMEEYISVALISIATPMCVINSFLGIGDFANEDAFKWICTNPKILTASSVICRLLDDIAGHEFEQKRGHIPSAVECYMKQYGVSEQEAIKVLIQEVENAWKDINEEFLVNPIAIPLPLLQANLNLSRGCNFVYKDGNEHYTNPYLMKDQIAFLLKDPVMI